MQSYRHQFHAGGVADVFKHAALTRILAALARKDKPFFVLDTHAGRGFYELNHDWSEKTGEWRDGVGRIWGRRDAPAALAPYLGALRAANGPGAPRRYPGSPWLIRHLTRPQDRLAFVELNTDDHVALEGRLRGPGVDIRKGDGFKAIRALLPPKERRGLTFIDASFDQAEEFKRILAGVADAHRRFATGIVAVWAPLMAPEDMAAVDARLQAMDLPRTLKLTLATRPPDWEAYRPGSVMFVVNAPYGLDVEAPAWMDWLWRALSPEGQGGATVDWLIPETPPKAKSLP